MERFPAVLIGGPPHSGKSVLAYSLTQALRRRGIDHYVLRAYPDGEGDWANEADQKLVRRMRFKGQGTPEWVNHICRDLAGRHLPLIVDVGGLPTADQERIFVFCTHAVLLTRNPASHKEWHDRMARHGVPVIADLTSRLEGPSRLIASAPVLRGVITGLERGATASGPVFEALVERLATLFACDQAELRRSHFALAPVELVIDLDRLAHTLNVSFQGEQATWEPHQLPVVLDYLPATTPLAIYGRGPNWLYAALASLAHPAPFYQFDVRLGWVQALSMPTSPNYPVMSSDPATTPETSLAFRVAATAEYTHIEGHLPKAYVDYSEVETLRVPPVPAKRGIILSGKLPQWLYTSLALTYIQAPWLAVFQPQLNQAVIVRSTDDAHIVGNCLGFVQSPPAPARR